MIKLFFGDNLNILPEIEKESIDFIYIDPPFNTGKKQKMVRQKNVKNDPIVLSTIEYGDSFEDLVDFLNPRISQSKRVLKPNGSLMFHIDYREAHYCKLMLDDIFGRNCFMNELIWAYDYGAKQKNRWPTKHNTIFWYVKDPNNYTFNYEKMWRLPYMAPGMVTAEKAALGKVCTDVIWHTIVPTNGKERTGYPTQKPEGLLSKFVEVHTNPGDLCLDFFAGSGTLGSVCKKLDRNCILIDNNEAAIAVMEQRLNIEKEK
jgi:site-specific DNA-methyltransferase (adenine-specific)